MKYFIVDAFCSERFAGNPAAICLQTAEMSDALLQQIAAEFNLSETAYLRPLDDGGEHWSLRWFTPAIEVDLCGHATLAAAHALWAHCDLEAECLRFETRSGELQVRKTTQGLAMRFPRTETRIVEGGWASPLVLAGQSYVTATAGADLLLELGSEAEVRDYQPDLMAIAALACRGLIVTAAGEGGVDFVSRFFAPQVGIDEDPVTGSAHCALADYWLKKLGKSTLEARQVSARGGELSLSVTDAHVTLLGSAVSVMAGELL